MLNSVPAFCAAKHPTTNDPIIIKRGTMGYAPWPKDQISPDDFNRMHDIDEAVIETMVACSMSGRWDTADVDAMRRVLTKGRARVGRDAFAHRLKRNGPWSR